MPLLRRQAYLSLLVVVIALTPLTVLAQETPIRVDGSRIVADIVEPVSAAAGVAINLEISGTGTGLQRLCAGEIDLANAARPITRAEEEACAASGVDWVEVPLGYDALAVVSNPAITTVQCVTFGELASLFGPGAAGTTTLNAVNPAWGEGAIKLYSPAAGSAAYNLLDTLLPGDGLRTDLTVQADPAALLSQIAEDPEGIGIIPLSALESTEAEVTTIALDDLSGAGCVAPSAAALADGSYPAASGLYVYVNAAALEREEVNTLLTALIGADGQAAVAAAGFVTLAEDTASRAAENVASVATGRQFSKGEPLYTIALDVAGTVTAEAAADAYSALTRLTIAFKQDYEGITINTTGYGNAAAYRKLCNGEVDLALVTRPASVEETAACADNTTTLWEAPLGHRALVMVVPEAAEFAACLTSDQVAALWSVRDGASVTNWNELGEDFPDLPVTIFLPRSAQNQTDFLLNRVSDELLQPRTDALQENSDALYRAAATANVEGAIAYMTYDEFLKSEAAVIPVAVDSGNGCVRPSLETIRDGSYALALLITLVVREQALARPEVQAVTWYAVRDTAASLLADTGVIPLEPAVFTVYQADVVARFAAAEAAAAAAQPTETPEPTTEATEATGGN